MKKHLTPAILFTAVFCTGFFAQRYSFIQQEYYGLFLWTSDWLEETFSGPMPLSSFLGSFLVQFYRIPCAGPLVTAAGIAAFWWICNTVFRFAGRWSGAIATVAACTAWYFAVKASDPTCLAGVLLIASVICLLFVLFQKHRTEETSAPAVLPISIAVIFLSGIILVADPSLRKREAWSKVEYASISSDWIKVLEETTPEVIAEDNEFGPFAALALSERGLFSNSLDKYGFENFDEAGLFYEDMPTRRGYLFGILLYEAMGCTNEAIHRTFQAATPLPHGSSFGTLRHLMRYNTLSGNIPLAEKYATILGRSPANAALSRKILDRLGTMPAESQLDDGNSADASTITHSTAYNMKVLYEEGVFNAGMADRVQGMLLLFGNNPVSE